MAGDFENRRDIESPGNDELRNDDRTSDTADHLLEDRDGEQFGTTSTRAAIERGFAYEPPDQPTQEGRRSPGQG